MAAPSTPAAAVIAPADDDSLSDTYRLIPRPLPFDASDSRYSHSQRDGLISRRDKTMTHLQQENPRIRSGDKKHKNGEFEEESKAHCFEMERDLPAKTYAAGYLLESLEDEDVCPICLEGICFYYCYFSNIIYIYCKILNSYLFIYLTPKV